MSDPMTVMFGPRRCALCGKDHYRGSPCPWPVRSAVTTRISVAGPRRMFVAEPSGQFISEEAESAFLVWEARNNWVWTDTRQREGAITTFSAGWIACADALSSSPTTTPDSLRDVMGGEDEGNTAFGLQPCGEASPDGEVFGHDTQHFDGKEGA